GMEVEVYPTGPRARIRGLQSHKRSNDRAIPVARVAANLVGVERRELERGNVIAEPGRWRPTSVIEARVVPVRALGHPLRERGAVRVADVSVLTGVTPREIEGAVRTGPWWVGEPIDDVVAGAVGRALEDYHRQHPLREGADLATVRSAAGEALERVGGTPDP